jgi:hypothetical protein
MAGIGAQPFPQTCEIGFAIRSARCWRSEVRFAIRGARDAGRPIVDPLRLERRHQDSQNDQGLEDHHTSTLLAPFESSLSFEAFFYVSPPRE